MDRHTDSNRTSGSLHNGQNEKGLLQARDAPMVFDDLDEAAAHPCGLVGTRSRPLAFVSQNLTHLNIVVHRRRLELSIAGDPAASADERDEEHP